MKFVCLVFLVLGLFLTSNGQYKTRYDRAGKLQDVFELTEPRNCGLITFQGPIKSIKTADGLTFFSVQTKNRERDIELELSQFTNVDRANLFHFILKRRHKVRISGYACGSNGVIEPVSIRSIR